MPFVTLDTMLVYSGIKYFETNKFISPFANAADGGYTKEEQKKREKELEKRKKNKNEREKINREKRRKGYK